VSFYTCYCRYLFYSIQYRDVRLLEAYHLYPPLHLVIYLNNKNWVTVRTKCPQINVQFKWHTLFFLNSNGQTHGRTNNGLIPLGGIIKHQCLCPLFLLTLSVDWVQIKPYEMVKYKKCAENLF